MKVGIIGLGVLGSAINDFLSLNKIDTIIYDKYKKIGNINNIIESDIIFLCLPTPFLENVGYDLSSINEILFFLSREKYKNLIIIKSTILPGTTNFLYLNYNLNIIHNPEFLSEKTALEDFKNQKHIVIGKADNNQNIDILLDFYQKYFINSEISICNSNESESMKIFCNTFYAVKIQIFNEFYLLCNKMNINFNNVKNLMLKNGWINSMHTNVPGSDGMLSYGGHCFPKDTNALLQQMIDFNVPNEVLLSCILERNKMRNNE